MCAKRGETGRIEKKSGVVALQDPCESLPVPLDTVSHSVPTEAVETQIL